MAKKEITFFGGTLFYDKLIEAFNEIGKEAINPISVHIAEHEFDFTSYGSIMQATEGFDKIQILSGVDTKLFSGLYGQGYILIGGKQTEPHAKNIYGEIFRNHLADSRYTEYQEKIIEEFIQDVIDERIDFRLHTYTELRTNIHIIKYQPPGSYAPVRKCIVGSGKLSHIISGGQRAFWMSAVIDDFNTVNLEREFDTLWKQAIPVAPTEIKDYVKHTHLRQSPSPYDLYLKVLIDYFDSQIGNTDSFVFPKEYLKLKYQTDAALQGFDMFIKHNGFFLADVVGLGKTNVAALVTQLFIKANGENTKALVIYPPNGEFIWKSTFQNFSLGQHTDFSSYEFLEDVINGKGYSNLQDYCVIIIDEVHNARNEKTILYSHLERICKTPRRNIGGVKDLQKKVICISATINNNTPKDIYNPLRLFQNVRNSTIQGVSNLHKYFHPKIKEYQKIMRDRKEMETSEGHNSIIQRIIRLYEPIRREVLDQITIRRTRNNILNNPVYKEDLQRAGISFPVVEPPRNIQYELDSRCQSLFEQTVITIIDRLRYARYKAIERINEEYAYRYPKSRKISIALGNLYRNILVKRLESSFTAFRSTLQHLLTNTEIMIKMFEDDKVIIAPEMKIKKLIERGWSFDEIIDEGMDRFQAEKDEFVYPASAFDPGFIEELREDAELLKWLLKSWHSIDEDSKYNKFLESIPIFLKPEDNPSGKLLIFTESADTAKYLSNRMVESLGRKDILTVIGSEYNRLKNIIHENFDANWKTQKDDFNIIVATNCIAETINLHRANVIINYDTPWNPVILMQRIGRINRIGTTAKRILNYLFYPSAQGDATINLYKNAVIKLQGFHAAFGEDSQIFSHEEIVQQFELFNPTIGDDEDKRGSLLNELREFHRRNPDEYERIKNLPPKSRAFREGSIALEKGIPESCSLLYIDSAYKSGYYCIQNENVRELTFLEAAELFRADPSESRVEEDFFRKSPSDRPSHNHFRDISRAFDKYQAEVSQFMNNTIAGYKEMDQNSALANKYLRSLSRIFEGSETIKEQIAALVKYLYEGVYAQLPIEINRLKRKYDIAEDGELIKIEIDKLYNKYYTETSEDDEQEESEAYGIPRIMVSETFLKET